MTGRLESFRQRPEQPRRVPRNRYALRKEAPRRRDQSILTYRQPGRGVSGESSN